RLAGGARRHRPHARGAAVRLALDVFRGAPARTDRRPRGRAAAVCRRRARARVPRLPRRRPHRPALRAVPAGARALGRRQGRGGGRPRAHPRHGALPRAPRRVGRTRMARRAVALRRPPAPDRGGHRAGERLAGPRRVRAGERERPAQARGAAPVHAALPAGLRSADPRRGRTQRPGPGVGGGGNPRRERLQPHGALARRRARPDAGAAGHRRRGGAPPGPALGRRRRALRPGHQSPHRHRLPARDEGHLGPAVRGDRGLQRRPHAHRALAGAAAGHGCGLLDRDHHLPRDARLRGARARLQRDLRLAPGRRPGAGERPDAGPHRRAQALRLPRVMDAWLVGGAVRDRLLGLPPGDRDWVVVGATPEAMLAAGFRAVGRDFPVFLHPETGEEHALARTERKSARGHRGFVVDAAPTVTLEEDLGRRDFTINAIAEGPDGALVDPYGGQRDLEARVLRHVGPAFAEDPLRVLRAARFMARFAPLGFTVAPETRALMREMGAGGELADLVPERVWPELARALRTARPSAFLRTLRACGALAAVLPEVDALYGVPQRAEYHPEVDTGTHVELVCDMAAALAPGDDEVGFAALVHDLGKALTPEDEWPRHVRHEQRGVRPVEALCARLRVPAAHRDLAVMACREHLNVHTLPRLRDATVHDLLARCDGFRRGERIRQLATVCEADKRGRAGLQDQPYPQAAELVRLRDAAAAVRGADLAREGLEGPAFGEALRKARIAAIAAARTLRAGPGDGAAASPAPAGAAPPA